MYPYVNNLNPIREQAASDFAANISVYVNFSFRQISLDSTKSIYAFSPVADATVEGRRSPVKENVLVRKKVLGTAPKVFLKE